MSNTEFIKIRNTLYNLQFIKQIQCDENECTIIVANTESGCGGAYSLTEKFKDTTLKCHRGKSPDCYEKLVKYIDDQK